MDGVHSTMAVSSPRKRGRVYTILRTTEIDSYEVEAAAAARRPVPGPMAPAPTGDSFKGTARKAAKISFPSGPVKTFKDLKSLIGSLPRDQTMASHQPPITAKSTSNRVSEENRNVRVKAFLYAASREDDNGFHLIIGRSPNSSPEMYMTMELSGLPPKTTVAHGKLKAARTAFKVFFGANLPGMTYDFYDPPIPVQVEGALFFDISHANGQRPGPQSLKSRIPTVWEVHPIIKIVLEP